MRRIIIGATLALAAAGLTGCHKPGFGPVPFPPHKPGHGPVPINVGPATRSLDGPFASEGAPVDGDLDGDGCIEPFARVDTDPQPNDADYCMAVP